MTVAKSNDVIIQLPQPKVGHHRSNVDAVFWCRSGIHNRHRGMIFR
jgi:hypothetical protein